MATGARRRKGAERAAEADDAQGQGQTVGEGLLLRVALEAFVEKGFHGTSMRDIAGRAGTSVSHTYYYFPSKQHILWVIMSGITQDLIDALEGAAAQAGPDPADRLAAVVRAHVLLHTERQAESFIGNTELRSLREEDRTRIVAQRDRVSAVFKAQIKAGLEQGLFTCAEPVEVNLAIVTMCTAVSGWYRADGAVPAAAIADRFAAIALRMVDYHPPTPEGG